MTTASPIKLRNGNWGVRVQGAARKGDRVQVVSKSGKSWTATVEKVVWSGKGVAICATSSNAPARRGSSKRSCRRCGCTDPTCGGKGICQGPSFDPCHDCW